ncbi:MAG: hypothetical protein EA417_02735 [Gammaproteobacteria bacterium]|nr:MAG: hypothetical protein EA417_02735 [Gammaproteobacteria bacterium]
MYQSLITYRGGRWFWISLLLCAVAIGLYVWHDLPQPPGGGTWLGYTLGTIGAVLILWLTYLGRRKRNYTSKLGTVHGWTSAHIYLGTSLIIIATLHAGFQFGWNVHTLAYVLMLLVIFSGFFGVWAYLRYPELLSDNTSGKTRGDLYREVAEIDKQVMRQVKHLGSEMSTAVASSLERTVVGGGIIAQLTARDDSQAMMPGRGLVANVGQKPILDLVVEQLSQTSHREQASYLREISNLIGARGRLLERIRRDVQIQGLLRIWLYFHVPLAFACVAALIVHVFSVFVYW